MMVNQYVQNVIRILWMKMIFNGIINILYRGIFENNHLKMIVLSTILLKFPHFQ